MAVGDILARLLLDDKEFNRKLGNSRKSVREFAQGMNKMGSSAGQVFRSFAGAAGVAFGAVEAFSKAMNANHAMQDKYDSGIKILQVHTDAFFNSITNADFSHMALGFDELTSKAKEYAIALQGVGDAQASFGYLNSKEQANFQESVTTLKDKKATPEQKAEAKATAEASIATLEEYTKGYAKVLDNAIQTSYARQSIVPRNEFSPERVEDALKADLIPEVKARFQSSLDEFDAMTAELQKKHATTVVTSGGVAGMTTGTGLDTEAYRADLDKLIPQYADALVYRAVAETTKQEEKAQLTSMASASEMARRQVASMKKSLNRALSGEDGGGGGKATSTPAPKGSISDLQGQISEAQKAMSNAVDIEARVAAQKTVDALKEQLASLNLDVAKAINPLDNGGTLPDVNSQFGGLKSSTPLTLTEEENKPVDNYAKSLENITSNADNAQIAIGALGNVMNALGGSTEKGAVAWLNYGVGVAQAVAQAVPALATLATSHKKKALAEGADAASGAGAAVANIPYVGPVMAIAAIASVLAAIATIPKFAKGGIVGGNSTSGDKILARLNSGEMVLNQEQQAKVLASMGASKQVQVTGKVVASGRELQVVLDNYGTYSRQ